MASLLSIGDIMTREVFTLRTSATVEEAASELAARDVGGAPVRDGAGRLVGLLSRSDLMDPERRARPGFPSVVRDVMTPALLALRPGDSARSAAALMVRQGVHRIVVLDAAGAL